MVFSFKCKALRNTFHNFTDYYVINMKCLNCDKEISGIPGKREKKFCGNNCRASYGQKHKKTGLQETIESAERMYAAITTETIEKVLGKMPEDKKDVPKIENQNDEPPKVGKTLSKYDQERRMKKLGF